MRFLTIRLSLILSLLVFTSSCEFSDENMDDIMEPSVTAIFNASGTREGNAQETLSEQYLIDRIDQTRRTLRVGVYGFSNRGVIAAVIRAHFRGVDVKVVGDARHFGGNERGYRMMQEAHIPMIVGNQFHIMHNKFFILDEYFTFVGTGNITSTGFTRNNNNWVVMESPQIAADFTAEWQQMWEGRFSTAKNQIDNGNTYKVGDTTVEVYFSPQEDAMGRILEELDRADTNVHFTIFAFTKDQVGSRFIQKHREFQKYNEDNDLADLPVISLDGGSAQPKKVVGVLDRSQIHGNFLYHEVYRLTAFGVPMRVDANENSRLPGDYQAGGGRLHSKTMIIDAGTPNARVITGSFNWSSSATIANDEVMLILRGEEIANEYLREFNNFWSTGKSVDQAFCNYVIDEDATCATEVEEGDVIFSEVHWYGLNGNRDPSDHGGASRDPVDNDEFIELYNTTDKPINLSLWTVTNGYDFKVGFTPGTVIQPGQYFLVLDHNLEPYSDITPQDEVEAFKNPDFVLNLANDPRFPRLNIQDSNMSLELVSAAGRTVDRAGDGSTPFGGGPVLNNDGTLDHIRTMERIITDGEPKGPGTEKGSWKTCELDEGGANVNDGYKELIRASPGEPNSP